MFSCITTKKSQWLSEISIIDQLEESSPIPLIQHTLRKSIKLELLSLTAKEEEGWRQKCKKDG